MVSDKDGVVIMKKRILKSIALVLVLVTCFSMTVMANPSGSGKPVIPDGWGQIGQDVNKEAVLGKIEELRDQYADELEELKNKLESGMTIIGSKQVTIDDTDSIQFPITICFDVAGVTPDTEGYVMLLTENGWVKVPTVMKNGKMCVTLDTLGLGVFSFVAATGSYNPVSPQTSASAAATVALTGLMAMAGAAGLKKREFDK